MTDARTNPQIMDSQAPQATAGAVKQGPMQNTKVPTAKPVAQPTAAGQTKR